MRIFGPVPSRRLGRSVGINNIPPKICTYSCVYCQLGRSLKVKVDRQTFYAPLDLQSEIKEHVQSALNHGESVDYLTVVPDGEPTLDENLGALLDLLKPLGIKLAVITNATLIDRPEVRAALVKADWVSLKVDAVDEKDWRTIDRPHRKLNLDAMMKGMRIFAREFKGQLVTETMLVKGINDNADCVRKIAEFLQTLSAKVSYLSVPTRPPAEPWVEAPDEEFLNEAYQIFVENGLVAEYLIGYEGNQFAFTGKVEEDLLSITSVHPMREDAVNAFLEKAGADAMVIEKLIDEKKLVTLEYNGRRFFLRKLSR